MTCERGELPGAGCNCGDEYVVARDCDDGTVSGEKFGDGIEVDGECAAANCGGGCDTMCWCWGANFIFEYID